MNIFTVPLEVSLQFTISRGVSNKLEILETTLGKTINDYSKFQYISINSQFLSYTTLEIFEISEILEIFPCCGPLAISDKNVAISIECDITTNTS